MMTELLNKIKKHKRRFWCLAAVVVGLYLIADNFFTCMNVGDWRGFHKRNNMLVMEKTMRAITAYQQDFHKLPSKLDLLVPGYFEESMLWAWTDREASSRTLFMIDLITNRYCSRHAQLLYFLPANSGSAEKKMDKFILLAEPYPQWGERYVYRLDRLPDTHGLPYPEKLSEAEFRRQMQNQGSQMVIYAKP